MQGNFCCCFLIDLLNISHMISAIYPYAGGQLCCCTSVVAEACRLSLSAHRLCSQLAFLGKLLAAASQSYKSYSGHLWMFSKHRRELRVCAYAHACTTGPLATSSSWKQCFRVLLFPGKGKIENLFGFFPSLSPQQPSCLEAASNQTMCEELGSVCVYLETCEIV